MNNQEDLIKQFQDLTSSNEQESKFYLESHGWDLESAIASFFESSNNTHVETHQPTQPVKPSQPAQPSQYSKSVSSSAKKPAASSSSSNRGGIRTLSDYGNEEGDDDHDHDHDDEDDDDDDKSQNYFTGGKASGIVVQSAPKGKKNQSKDEIVDGVFEGAKSQGAVPQSEPSMSGNQNQPKYTAFDGKAFQLGNNSETPSKVIENKVNKPEPEKEVKITFWSQGFTVDDEPLRSYSDPSNKEFVGDIQRGFVPRELQSRFGARDLPIVLVDNRNQEWKEPPKPKYVAFSGGGQALGGGSNNNNNNNSATTSTTSTTKPSSAPKAQTPSVSVDSSQPTTTIQIKLADGSRLQSTFNHTHTLADVINYINSASANSRAFDLLTGFPQKPLTISPSTSLKDAGLLNSLLIQKFK